MKTKSIHIKPAIGWILSGCAIVSNASAATISESAIAPSVNILASQLTDLGPGTFDGGRNYADNGGPPGQTFTVGSASVLGSVTVMGRGDSAGFWNNGPQPMTGSEVWGVQIASVNGDGSLNVLDFETATGFAAPANIADYLTFTLANSVSLSAGVNYAFSIDFNGTQSAWFGLAHSDSDVYSGGYAINNNSSIANPGANGGGARYAFNGFAAPVPGNYDYVFAVQGVPEPGTFAFLLFGGLGLAVFGKRRD